MCFVNVFNMQYENYIYGITGNQTGVTAPRTMWLLKRNTGRLLQRTVSTGNTYTFGGLNGPTHQDTSDGYVVYSLDTDGNFNAAIADRCSISILLAQ